MKKKMITLMLAAMMAASPAAAFAGETEGSQSQVLFSDDEKGLIYSGAVPVQDVSGNSSIALFFVFQNNTSDPKMASTQYFISVFQNGIQLDPTIAGFGSFVADAATNGIKQIKDGAVIAFADLYKLQDNSEVEVRISDSIMGDNVKTLEVDPTITTDGNGEPVQAETDQAAAPQTEAPDYERMYNDLLAKYNELLKKYSVLLEQESEQ